MFKLFPGKTAFQMRREAERAYWSRRAVVLSPVDPARRPPLYSDSDDAAEAASDWLAHIAAGRITVR